MSACPRPPSRHGSTSSSLVPNHCCIVLPGLRRLLLASPTTTDDLKHVPARSILCSQAPHHPGSWHDFCGKQHARHRIRRRARSRATLMRFSWSKFGPELPKKTYQGTLRSPATHAERGPCLDSDGVLSLNLCLGPRGYGYVLASRARVRAGRGLHALTQSGHRRPQLCLREANSILYSDCIITILQKPFF